jgi:putative tricarboxylic transport membrane protein
VKFNDAISGSVLLAIALAILFNIQSFPKIPGQNIGPAAFPGLLASLLAVCAVLLIVKGFRSRSRPASDASNASNASDVSGIVSPREWLAVGPWLRSPAHLRNFLVTVGCLLFYIFASEFLGFIVASILILGVMFITLGVRHRLILPIAVGATLVIHLVFYKGLRVPLPWGILLPLAW